MIAAISSE